MSYIRRYELATLAGVTLSSSGGAQTVGNTISKVGNRFWTGLGTSFPTGGQPMGDAILGTCTGGQIDATVGGTRTVVAYTASPAAPCLPGDAMDHRAAFLPFQPEDGGSVTDRRFLYNIIGWIKGS